MLDIEPRHLAEVRRIVKLHAGGLEVRAFGSRVRGGAKPHSDLDLAVMTKEPLPMSVKVRLESALAESDLPFKVDVLYWDETSDTFHRLIDRRGSWSRRGLDRRDATRPPMRTSSHRRHKKHGVDRLRLMRADGRRPFACSEAG